MTIEVCNLMLATGKDQGEFKIPLKAALGLIEERAAESRDDYRGMADTLQQGATDGRPLKIAFRSFKRVEFMLWEQLLAALFDQKLGAAKCAQCGCWVEARDLLREVWETGSTPLQGGGGRRYQCPCGEVVLDVADWRS